MYHPRHRDPRPVTALAFPSAKNLPSWVGFFINGDGICFAGNTEYTSTPPARPHLRMCIRTAKLMACSKPSGGKVCAPCEGGEASGLELFTAEELQKVWRVASSLCSFLF